MIKIRLKRIMLAVVILLLLGISGLWLWSFTGTYTAGATTQAAMQSSGRVEVSDDNWIVLDPAGAGDRGLIFYPGGLVEPAAYAPVLHNLAAAGYLVVIAPMPFNLAIFNTNAADAVIAAYPQIETWTLAGHSLGGAAASIYAENHPGMIDSIAFWDSYPANYADLSDNALPVLSIYGTLEGQPNTDGFDDQRTLVPETTQFVAIEGANHAQFGDYGPQDGDVQAVLSLNEQHALVSQIMLDFLSSLP